jgi:hypothetical protein
MEMRGAAVRRTAVVEVPAHVAFERMCRIEEYPYYRHQVREVSALSEDVHRWDIAGASFTVQLDERQPDRLLRWHSIDGPPCDEVVAIKELTPRRCQVTVELNGPATLVDGLAVDLPEFKRLLEQAHPQVGHFVNERPAVDGHHRSNWRDRRMIGRTNAGARPMSAAGPDARPMSAASADARLISSASTSERPARPGLAP